jgi:hypothetical protein
MLRRHVLPELGRLKVANVQYQDIDRLHRALKVTPHQANRAVALLSMMFSLAQRWGWRADNPCRASSAFPSGGASGICRHGYVARIPDDLGTENHLRGNHQSSRMNSEDQMVVSHSPMMCQRVT